MKARLQKSQFSNLVINWGKIKNAIKAFQKSQFPVSFMNWEKLGNIHSPRPDHLWMSWENFCPNLSFTFEVRWGIHIKD